MLFIVIHWHSKWKWITTAFDLIIFYCSTTVYVIRFSKYFYIYCLFVLLIVFQNKMKSSLLTQMFHYKQKIYWCIILREFTLKIFMKIYTLILFLIHTWYTSSTQSCILKENFRKPTHLIFHFFFFSYFLLRWINSNKFKFELVHLHKNIKTKENCFKKF